MDLGTLGSIFGGLSQGLAQGAEAGISLSQRQQQIDIQQQKADLEKQHAKLKAISMIGSLEKWSDTAIKTMGPAFFKQMQSLVGEDALPQPLIDGYLKGDPQQRSAMRQLFTDAVVSDKIDPSKWAAATEGQSIARVAELGKDISTIRNRTDLIRQRPQIMIMREAAAARADTVATGRQTKDFNSQLKFWFDEASKGRTDVFQGQLRQQLYQNPDFVDAIQSQDVEKAGKIFRDKFAELAQDPKTLKVPAIQEKVDAIKRIYPQLSPDDAEAVARGTKRITVDNTGKVMTIDQGKGTVTETPVQPSQPLPPAPTPRSTIVEETQKGNISGVGPFLADHALRTFGQVVPQFEFQKRIAAGRAMVEATQGQLLRSLAINPRFPVGEMKQLQKEVEIAPSAWDSKEALLARIQGVDAALRTRYMNAYRDSLDPSLPKDDRNKQSVNARAIKQYLVQLGNRPQGLPPNATRFGVTKDGLPVYSTPDGKKYVDDLSP